MNSKHIGDITTAMVLASLLKIGKTVLIPWGDNQRYDLVIDEQGIFKRIQCKTGKLKNGSIYFDVCSCPTLRGNDRVQRPYTNEVEFFGVYCPQNHKTYLVPINLVGIRKFSLRVNVNPHINQYTTSWAKDYEIGPEVHKDEHSSDTR